VGKKGFRELLVWQRAKDLAVKIYLLSQSGALGKDFELIRQLRKSSVSIASNVAEGDERETDKEAVRFFYIAKGSLAELRTQIQIGYEAGHLQQAVYEDIEPDCDTLGKMLGGLIRTRSRFRRP